MITLVEWGGTRPVLKGMDMISRASANNWIQVGAVGADSVSREDSTAWEPLQKLTEKLHFPFDADDIMLSDAGPYITINEGDNDDLTTTYHRIDNNNLVSVCSVEDERWPPPGIRDATND